MQTTLLIRVTRFAFQNFWRDIWLSTVTIVIFVLAVTLVSTLSGVKVVTDQAITVLKSKVDVTVSFKAGTGEKIVKDLEAQLEKLPETASVTFMSAGDNLEAFKRLHANDPLITQGTDAIGSNPFGPSLKIQARTLDEYPKIAKVLEDQTYADAIESGAKTLESNQLAIQKLSSFTKNVGRFSLVLTLVFSLIAVLVVVNTMRIAIYAHREEIGIMKLVGASNSLVRLPFVIEGLFIGLISILIASLILFVGISLLSGWFNSVFQGYDVNITAYFRLHFLTIFWQPLLGALVLAVVSAGIAVNRYLRV